MLAEEEFYDLISKTIRNSRNARKLSCEKLAALSDIDYSSLNLIENRKQTPRAYTLYKIFHSLNIDILNQLNHIPTSSEDLLISKIRLMDKTSQTALLNFLDEFTLRSQNH